MENFVQEIEIHEGVNAHHLRFTADQKLHSVESNSREMIWLTCIEGRISFRTETMDQVLELTTSESVLVAIPPSLSRLDVRGYKGEAVVTSVGLKLLHEMLAVNFDPKQMDRSKFDYKAMPKVIQLSPSMINNIQSCFLKSDKDPFKKIHDYGNFLTSFSHVMGRLFGQKVSECPVRLNLEAEQALREVHRRLISNLSVIPDTRTLALQVKLPENLMIEGFKHVYGKSVYRYYLDYKMDHALVMLKSGQHLIKEIAYELGYQNPSHFISAFKKKFGATPRQFIQMENG